MDPDRPAKHIWWYQYVKFYMNDVSSGAESTEGALQ